MDKGKNPLLEDEDMFFMHGYQPQFPDGENLVSNNTSFYDKHEGSGSGLGSDLGLGLVDGTSILDEMEEAEENFFSKFISMNIGLIDSPAFETSSVVPAPSNPMDPSTDPVPQEQAPPETIVSLPAPAGSTDDAPQPIVRRCLSAAALAEIAQHDPKRAKRIITNRLSAVRAKEKKKLYICMLEHKLQCLLSERDALSAKSNINQRDNYCLKAESNRLKESLDNMEQLMRLQDCKDFFHFFAVLVLFFQFTF
ncbi:transcription factor RF2a-like [Quercus suber]|uniref:transcription factor RF2a-like n=1 Tax=Quercus suber TaxID=58331 RepID=UPI0032DEDFA6